MCKSFSRECNEFTWHFHVCYCMLLLWYMIHHRPIRGQFSYACQKESRRRRHRMYFASGTCVLPNQTAASRSSNCQLFRSAHDARAIAINLKTRLFSICIGSAAAASARWDVRLDARFHSLVRRAHLQSSVRPHTHTPRPPTQWLR